MKYWMRVCVIWINFYTSRHWPGIFNKCAQKKLKIYIYSILIVILEGRFSNIRNNISVFLIFFLILEKISIKNVWKNLSQFFQFRFDAANQLLLWTGLPSFLFNFMCQNTPKVLNQPSSRNIWRVGGLHPCHGFIIMCSD